MAEAATYTTHNKHNRRTSMTTAGFEPAFPAIEQLQTYALDCTATGIGNERSLVCHYYSQAHTCIQSAGRTEVRRVALMGELKVPYELRSETLLQKPF